MNKPLQISPPPFPIDALPEKTRQVVAAIYELTKAPVPLIVSSVLSALSMAAQGRYRLQLEDGQITVPSLFMINICDAGNHKTAVASKAFAGIQQAEKTNNDNIRSRWSDQVKAAASQAQAQAQASLNEVRQEPQNPSSQPVHLPTQVQPTPVALGPVPATPPTYQLIYPDIFDNALYQAISKRQHIAVIINTEADHVFEAGTLPHLDRFCSGWDCHDLRELEEVTIAKNSRNKSSIYAALPQAGSSRDVRWPNTHISAALCVRSQTVQSHIEEQSKNARASGFLERSLFTLDTAFCTAPMLTISPSEQNMLPIAKVLLVLDEFKNKTCFTALQKQEHTLKLDQLAAHEQTKTSELNKNFQGYCTSLIGFDAYLSYQEENILRIALLLFVMEHSDGYGQLHENEHYLDEACLHSAYQLVYWHLHVYLELFAPSIQRPSAVQADTNKLEAWLAQQLKGLMTTSPGLSYLEIERNKVLRSGPLRGVGGAQQLNQALEQLTKQGKVTILTQALPNSKKVQMIRFQVCAENQNAPTNQCVPAPVATTMRRKVQTVKKNLA